MADWNDDRKFEESINTDQFIKEISQDLLENQDNRNNNYASSPKQKSQPFDLNSYYNRNSERQPQQQQQQMQIQARQLQDNQKSKVDIDHLKTVVQNTAHFNKMKDSRLLSESRIAMDRRFDHESEANEHAFQKFVCVNSQIPIKGRGNSFGQMRSSDQYVSIGDEAISNLDERPSSRQSIHKPFPIRESSYGSSQSQEFANPPAAFRQVAPPIVQKSYYNKYDSTMSGTPQKQPISVSRIRSQDDKMDTYNVNAMRSALPNSWSTEPQQQTRQQFDDRSVQSPLRKNHWSFENHQSSRTSFNGRVETENVVNGVNGNAPESSYRRNDDKTLSNARPVSHGYYQVYLCGETRNDAIANRIEKTLRLTENPPKF
ncbi:unnamed protein product [Caenorhabditis angaria]|uniref:Uncharacterized protein n=1 Tax=Caenorhabditis angaria TaxID=860376 RepID=A0A9P1IKU5_9PELO|nr:unnamed protein product [Caenorhabditis angaria]